MNLVELAQRIKALRREQNLTLEQIATRTGLTRSVLSKVENFRVTPSLPALGKIALALGTNVSDLTAGLDERPQLVIVRSGEGVKVERDKPESQITYESLAHDRYSKSMEPLLLSVPPGTARKSALKHEGEEFIYVLSGNVELEYGEDVHHLKTGDSVYFDAQVEHRLINSTTELAKVLSVFGGG
ncbi:MAG: cupin domain-containing protein [Pirellulales bacterium]|nr:cupin domain-containing protein [Pirellulales bacterium]